MGCTGGMVALWRNTLGKSKQKHNALPKQRQFKKIGVGWHGGTQNKYSRQVEALKNGQLTLALFGLFFGVIFLHPLFFRILGLGAKPLGGPDRPYYYWRII